jgi:hypothetical protein
MTPVGISILTNGRRLGEMQKCVSSLLSSTSRRPLILAVFDNGSTDDTWKWLGGMSHHADSFDELEQVEWRVRRSDEDLGVSVGTNKAMAMVADCEWAIHIESDFELLPPEISGHGMDWLDRAIEWMELNGRDYLYLRRIIDEKETAAHWWWRWPGRIADSDEPFQRMPGFWWSNNPHLRRNRALYSAGVIPVPERPKENKDKDYWSKSEEETKAPPNAAITRFGLFVHDPGSRDPSIKTGCGRFDKHGAITCKYGFFQDPESKWCRACDPLAPWTCIAEHFEGWRRIVEKKIDATVATVWVDKAVLNGILAKSLSGCNVERLLTKGKPDTCLAAEYNKMLDVATSDIVVFAEPDAEFSYDGLENLVAAVSRPGVGAAGLVGARKQDGEVWAAKITTEMDVETLDTCIVAVDRRKGIRFDEATFTGLHMHVEDFCCQVRAKKMRCIVVPARKFEHHSTTWRVRGPDWGDYGVHKRVLLEKWREVLGEVTTT